jgi:hypothetical protein
MLTLLLLRNVTLGEFWRVCIISDAASIFLIATRPCPYLAIASATNLAASASPSALRIFASFSCSRIYTIYLALSASY